MAGIGGGVPPVKICEMVWACGWGVGCVPPVKMVGIVKMVWACGWVGGGVP